MHTAFKISQGTPYPLGVSIEHGRINVAMVSQEGDCGIIFYDADKNRLEKISLSGKGRLGDIWYTGIETASQERLLYQLYQNGRIIIDQQIKAMDGHTRFGERCNPGKLFGVISYEEYNWEDDQSPQISYENSILYCMHPRGFTRHSSSGVTNKGTFSGVTEKIPYLKELGITTVEFMPVYEFEEKQMLPEKEISTAAIVNPMVQQERKKDRMNYWGYERGCYYVPKNAYAAGDSVREFKDMVKAFHRNHMEVILQFYFPDRVLQNEILDILKYWLQEYHVDGFHLKGEKIPLLMLGEEPGLRQTKLWYYDFPVDEIYDDGSTPAYRNLARYSDDYMYTMRKFLKGDEDMLSGVIYHMRNNPVQKGQINYLTNYYGFTLTDMVSFERKHNLENGEENRDGNDYNHTWNCGAEGKSRKKAIKELRNKQIRNALCLLFFSQGTPLIFMGDEFGNSQEGNNNPYGQDNEISWLNWNNLLKNQELFAYTKELIALRMEHPILHEEKEFRIMDYISCGYPDLSYHGSMAWRPDMSNYSRHIAMMYCGKYAKAGHMAEDDFFYIAMNMHWEKHEFALPKLPKNMQWQMLADTQEFCLHKEEQPPLEDQQKAVLPPRTVHIYIGKEIKKEKKERSRVKKNASMETL